MRRRGRRLLLGILVAVTAGGCVFGRKPYAADPLFDRRARFRTEIPKGGELDPPPSAEPVPPSAPPGPLIGGDPNLVSEINPNVTSP